MAVSHFSNRPGAYTAHPFVIAGTCKRENEFLQREVLETAWLALTNAQDQLGGRLYCITSDSDAKQRLATAKITLQHDIAMDSPLRHKFSDLRLFNYKVGPDNVSGDVEYKHLIKRLRNTAIRSKGITISSSLINQSILQKHLPATDHAIHRINSIINPSDKQDIKLAYDLLSCIAVLPPAIADEDSPTVHNTRNALQLLGHLYTHILEAYTNVNLSLHDQLVHLSATAHLLIAIYSIEKGKSMPSQTYFDWMTNIKNQYLCVAKTQVDNPDGSWWLILVGTDALKSLFGRVRTMIGADSNADIKQLANHIELAALCNRILAENPHWERGPRRLAMKTWCDEAGDIFAKLDHINPASWHGNVAVKSVVLLTCWENGRSMTVSVTFDRKIKR